MTTTIRHRYTTTKLLLLLLLLMAGVGEAWGQQVIRTLPVNADFESNTYPFDAGSIVSGTNVGKVLQVYNTTATARFPENYSLKTNETLSVSFTAYHGWISGSKTSSVKIVNEDGMTIVGYTYNLTSLEVTDVVIGNTTAPGFEPFGNASSRNNGNLSQNANGLTNKPYSAEKDNNPFITMTISGNGLVTFNYYVAQQGLTKYYSTVASISTKPAAIVVTDNTNNADRAFCMDNLQVYSLLYGNNYESGVCDWVSSEQTRYTASVAEEDGNHFVSVVAVDTGGNGTTVSTSSTYNVASAGQSFILSFDMKLKGGSNQTSSFKIYESGNSDLNLKLEQTAAEGTVWKINGNDSHTVTLDPAVWYGFQLTRLGNTITLFIKNNSTSETVFNQTITTLNITGGLGKMEFDTKRYYSSMAIDNIYVQPLGWEVTELSVALTDVDDNNKLSSLATLPSMVYNPYGGDVTFSYDGTVLGNFDTSYPPRLKSTGDGTVSATLGSSGTTATYTMHVTSATGGGTYNSSTNTYTFTSIGTLGAFFSVTDVTGVTMTLGEDNSDGSPTSLVVNDPTVGPVLKAIDGNGYSHPNLDGGRASNTIPAKGINGGTYYVFRPSSDGVLTVEGNLSNATIYRWDGTGEAEQITSDNHGTQLRAGLFTGHTYYLYNGKLEGQANPTPLLHSFSFAPKQLIAFSYPSISLSNIYPGQTFTNAATNSTEGGGALTYSSSDESVATVNAITGEVTIHKGGHALIMATAAAITGYGETTESYPLDLNVNRKWVFDSSYGSSKTYANKTDLTDDELTLTQDDDGRWKFISGGYVQLGVNCQISTPPLTSGKVVEVIASAGHRNNISFTNALDIDSHAEVESVRLSASGVNVLRFYVKNDGAFSLKGQNSNDTYIHAIYVYSPTTISGTMTYNQGLALQAGGGKAYVTSLSSTFTDYNSRSVDGNIFGSPIDFSSDDVTKLTVNATTGEATPVAVTSPTVTVTAKAYPTKDYVTTYAKATVTAAVTVESSTDKASKSIAISDLMYEPMANSGDNGLDRTIPCFELTMTGGNKLMSSGDGTKLTLNGGNIRVAPRYKSPHSYSVYIRNAVVYYDDGTAEKIANEGDKEYIDIGRYEKVVTHIYVDYQCSDSGTGPDTQLDETKVTPTISFPSSTYQIEKDKWIDYIPPTLTPKNLRDLIYTSSGDYVNNVGGRMNGVSVGSQDLYASFTETTYFNALPSTKCYTIQVVAATDNTPTIDCSSKLSLEGVSYGTTTIEGFVFVNEEVTMIPSLNGNTPSGYTVTYSTSDNSIAYPSTDRSKIYTTGKQGLVTVIATFTPADPSSSPLMTATYQLQVLGGFWDFRNYRSSDDANMNSGSAGSTSPNGWTSSSTNAYVLDRTSADYLYILQQQNEAGQPLGEAIGLKTQSHARLTWTRNNGDGYLFLFGNKNGYDSRGGVVRVPVREGMIVEINARASGDKSEMTLAGLNDLTNTAEQSSFDVNSYSESQYFIANRDGYFEISNLSESLQLIINYIKLSSDMEFRYGKDTYVSVSTAFNNTVMNQGASTLTFKLDNVKNVPVTNNTSDVSADGTVTTSAVYGIFEVVVSASGGKLDGKTGVYRATSIGFSAASQSAESISALGVKIVDDLRTVLTVETGNTFGADNSDEALAAEAAIKDKVTFSLDKSKTTATATLTGRKLVIEGAGKVYLHAKVGSIDREFSYEITGGALGYHDGKNDIACPNYVLANDKTTHTIKIIGSATSCKFDVKKMREAVLGDLKSASLLFYDGSGNDVTSSTELVASNTLRIEGYGGKGGVIPIYASYEYESNPHSLEGTLTVAYSKHVWNFEGNLIPHLRNWYSSYTDESTNSKSGKWTTTATFDMPTDHDDATFATSEANSHLDSHDWRFVRKIGGVHYEASTIYYYNHNVEGDNALVIPETEGLVLTSSRSDEQLGVEMASERVSRKPNASGQRYQYGWGMAVAFESLEDNAARIVENIYDTDGNEINTSAYLNGNTSYRCSNLMVKRGGRITIPKVKPGQWIETRWTRHQDDMAERILMENLVDMEGTYINKVYKIGNCYYDQKWSTSTYMFKVAPAGTPRGDGTFVTLDEDGCVDVTFEIADNIYISIQQIELHEPEWNPVSSILSTLNGYDYPTSSTEAEITTLSNSVKADWNKNNSTPSTAHQLKWQYIWEDTESHTVALLPKAYQNAPNAPQTWTFEMDDMLKRSGAEMVTVGPNDSEATITYNGGWGKVTITMTSYSQNMRYVANKRSWTITFGQAPKQTYPYTWDFTKFFSSTLGSTLNEPTWAAVDYSIGSTNPLRVVVYNNTTASVYDSEHPNKYNTADYQSYYVEGAQLVSYGLRNTNNGIIRETDGLGFKLDTDDDGIPEQNMLMLNMNYNIASAQQAVNGQTWKTDTGEDAAKRHTDNSHLTIGSGGKVIVPKPNPKEGELPSDYYIYIKSSHEPSAYTNVVKMVKESAGANEELDPNYDVPTGVYKYRFNVNENAEFTFTSTDAATDGQLHNYEAPVGDRKYTDIYAIAVTKDFKQVKRLNGVGWATESRGYAVDYTLDSLLTNRPLRAYSVIARSTNPLYSQDKTKTTVRLQDRNYVVPARQGLVLKQVTDSPEADGDTYSVPLFVPAITTAAEPDYTFTNNLMRPNLNETTFGLEQEDFNGSTCVRFILSEKYMTWRKEGTTTTFDDHFITGTVPGFYRMRVFTDTDYDSGTLTGSNRNTLAANKAYLLLRADKLNYPLWYDETQPAREFVGIEGVSDMEDITDNYENLYDSGTYNLRGQKVDDDGTLPPGIYVRNGKKIFVK